MKRTGRFGKIYVVAVLLVMYLPVIILVLFSFNETSQGTFTGLTLKWYDKLLRNKQLLDSLKVSLELALYSCISAAIVGTAGAVGMSQRHFRTQGFLENMTLVPIMIPEIILGIAYLAFFAFLKVKFGMVPLVLAHTTFCIPYIYVNVKGRLQGLDPSIPEAALDLGASRTRMFFDITLPLITPAVMSGMLLAFAMSLDDVVISFFLNGPTTNTLPLRVYSMLRVGITPEINAICTLMLVAIFIVIAVYQFAAWRKAKREEYEVARESK